MELILPAGSPKQAWEAIENGADAVYFGLKNFSARKAAHNFSREEARELKQLCLEKGKKLYCTVNTVIKETELRELAGTLRFLEYLETDGIIMQDFAVLNLVRRMQIEIPLHASTQTAVHNADGARFMQKAGIRRIIPARELTAEEIEKIHSEVPEMEIEVFVHGAMCYSISGDCFASSAITGRSGNRGECVQICRTWFSSPKGSGYYFSAADLHRGTTIHELEKCGVSSLKIEGRMKSPQYAGLAAKYYRQIIDENTSDPELEKQLVTSFSRTSWPGFSKTRISGMTDSEYPGTRGLKAGEVISCSVKTAVLKLETDLSARDGVMFFFGPDKNGLPETLKMAWPVIRKKDKQIFNVKAGETTEIKVNKPVAGVFFKISSAENPYKGKSKPGKLIKFRKAAAITALIYNDSIRLKSLFHAEKTYKADFSKSTGSKSFDEVFRSVLSKSGDSLFCSDTRKIIYKNDMKDRIFAPPSLLKAVKNDFFALLERKYLEFTENSNPYLNTAAKKGSVPIKQWERGKLSPEGESPLPFFTDFSDKGMQKPAETGPYSLLPLNPVQFKTDKYLADLKKILEKTTAAGKKPLVGLNNPAHLMWARELSGKGYEFFIDYALCCANSESLDFFRQNISGISAFVPWIEDRTAEFDTDVIKIYGYDHFSIPLFTSRHCYFSGKSGCTGCSRKTKLEILSQNKKKYLLYEENCINYLIPENLTLRAQRKKQR